MTATTNLRFDANQLIEYATNLLRAAGAESDKATTTAALLVEADLMGHMTHGLKLCVPYLNALIEGKMRGSGTPDTIAETVATVVWDGNYLPGVWLTAGAVDLAVSRAKSTGIAAVSIRRSHHIGCLAVFLERATREGLALLVTCSDPSMASVAPFGGIDPLFTPNPIAIGIPTEGTPVLIDVSMSVCANGTAARLKSSGESFPGLWALDAEGRATDDPQVLFDDPPGTLLPIGGLDHGYKGYALGLFVEMLSQGLAGHGRADRPEDWGASVFVQAWDPRAFAGVDAFTTQTQWLAEAVHGSRPRPAIDSIRLPGERALQKKTDALANGVTLDDGIMDALVPWGDRLGVAQPPPLEPDVNA